MLFEHGSFGASRSISSFLRNIKWIQTPDVAAAAGFCGILPFFLSFWCVQSSVLVLITLFLLIIIIVSQKMEKMLQRRTFEAANVKLWLSTFHFLTHLQLQASTSFTFFCITTQQSLWDRKTAGAAAGWSALCNAALNLKTTLGHYRCEAHKKLHLCATALTCMDDFPNTLTEVSDPWGRASLDDRKHAEKQKQGIKISTTLKVIIKITRKRHVTNKHGHRRQTD